MAPYVATLTTINTPHRGCIFAEYLLGKVPEAARQKIAAAYNSTMKKLGDEDPDFLGGGNGPDGERLSRPEPGYAG